MGRTIPTYRQVLDILRYEWTTYRRALRMEDRERFDRLMGYARAHADAGSQSARPDAFEPVVISILLEQQKQIDSLTRRWEEER